VTARPRCGNDPRAQLTPGDRAAVAEFRAYLTARAKEKTTMSDLDAAREALRGYSLRPGFVDAVERFEAAVRSNERAGSEARRLGTPDHQPPPPVATPIGSPAPGLVVHGAPINIGWVNGRLDARLRLSVHPEMEPIEREQLLADLRDAVAVLVPVLPAGREAQP